MFMIRIFEISFESPPVNIVFLIDFLFLKSALLIVMQYHKLDQIEYIQLYLIHLMELKSQFWKKCGIVIKRFH